MFQPQLCCKPISMQLDSFHGFLPMLLDIYLKLSEPFNQYANHPPSWDCRKPSICHQQNGGFLGTIFFLKPTIIGVDNWSLNMRIQHCHIKLPLLVYFLAFSPQQVSLWYTPCFLPYCVEKPGIPRKTVVRYIHIVMVSVQILYTVGTKTRTKTPIDLPTNHRSVDWLTLFTSLKRLFVLQIAPDGFLDDLQDGGNGNPRLVAKWAVSKPKIRFTYLYRMV